MADPISNITIVGGGTAGWMTAMLMNAMFRGEGGKSRMGITLIESPNVPTVGVGEATVPGMPRVLKTCGVSEREFFKACNASFKLGVMFQKWNVDRNGDFIDYVNPFGRPGYVAGVDLAYYYLREGAGGLEFAQTYAPALDLIRAGKGPRPLGQPEFSGEAGYAYHLDAGRFAGLMRDISKDRGVVHILDDVVDVTRDGETGNIASLVLQERGEHPVELVIDCTGFRGLLINKVLEEPFIPYSKYLANDRALAVQIPHEGEVKVDCATRSTALGAGWSWRVPLFNRVGTGYVFSSSHRTDEEAMTEFLGHLGPEGEGLEPRVIPMRVGRSRNLWVKNCVAIGLSGGFIEPLESTAIHMIDTSIRWLFTYFPDTDFAPVLRDSYNRLTGNLYDEVRDFICLHYALGNRTDSQYWIDARTELEVPDSLARNLELWQHVLPGAYDIEFQTLFPFTVYQAVMLGKRVYETGYGKERIGQNFVTRGEYWRTHLGRMRASIEGMVANAADHTTLLRDLRGEPLVPDRPQQPPVFAGFGGPSATIATPGAKMAAQMTFPPVKPAKDAEPADEASLL
ncbi:tryptophan 7-halogenase [Roseibacterium beibuensis]|uniref:Tryptophan 7-halogenase n=1 Tax=[Roseibacterium] beibuensis TaxID=1193142 RepID=A0ABP9LAL9_9RHOB|nr:tryptophan halogenase family protein [Roseibacterium beibuensis]MCS6624125.1 tryptophan 7-halogenase [Roseibacterium beibuensis]